MRLAAPVLTLALACGAAPAAKEIDLPGTAGVRISPAGPADWLVVLETLQPQLGVTAPRRVATLVNAHRTFTAPDGWLLIDGVGHPSGDVSLLSVSLDPAAAYPLRFRISRESAAGGHLDRELVRLPPPQGQEAPPALIFSLDRARLAAAGEDAYAVVRWANNGVQAQRMTADLTQEWAAWIEPPAPLFLVGIIGGGFDNFHQGDRSAFVHADADGSGGLLVAVESTQEVLANHDAFFGEHLTARADPARFDFGAAIATRLSAAGERGGATLLGLPGRQKRLLGLRVAGEVLIAVGRIKTGGDPESWDGWLAAADAASLEPRWERSVDLDQGDMFWDVAPLEGGRLLAVGSTAYTQNPGGLSVSDAREALAVVLDGSGAVERRIALPAGPPGRGNEAISVVAPGGRVAIAGVENAPGTHAEVFSDAFVLVPP